MKTPRKLKNIEALAYYRAVFFTAETVSDISLALKKNGFTPDILEEGQALLKKAREIYDMNLHKKDELASARVSFILQRKEVEAIFRTHRNKALLIYKHNRRVLQRLAIDGKYPRAYDLWFETVRKFYSVAANDKKIGKGLWRLSLTQEEIQLGLENIARLESLFAAYMKRKGESQHLTVIKDKAFNECHNWMLVFLGVARLSLKDTPKLMSSLTRHF